VAGTVIPQTWDATRRMHAFAEYDGATIHIVAPDSIRDTRMTLRIKSNSTERLVGSHRD
jgi:hypothetical protein